jgi:gluconolactonase
MRFDVNMLPTHLVYSDDAKYTRQHMTNLAFSGPDYKTIYITESLSGDVLRAKMPVAGKKLFGLQ